MNKLEKAFPNLRNSDYKITSEKDPSYNCFAWAMGCNNRWWDPSPSPFAHWFEEPRDSSTAAVIRFFNSIAYEVCSTAELELDHEKIAIYEKEGLPTHVARQLASGEWTSKCGKDEDITHLLEGLEDSDYGKVSVIMKRRISDRGS